MLQVKWSSLDGNGWSGPPGGRAFLDYEPSMSSDQALGWFEQTNPELQELTHTSLLAPDSRRATHLPTPPHHATNSRYPTRTNTPNHAYPRTVQHQPNRANRPPTHTQIKQQATAKERQGKPNTNKTTQRNIGC